MDYLDFDPNADSDSTCRDDEACLCHECKKEKVETSRNSAVPEEQSERIRT